MKSGMKSTHHLKVDEKGRLHIPKEVRQRLGIRTGSVSGRVEGQALIIEPTSNLFDKLAGVTKFNFDSVERSLPKLRRSAERQALRELE